MNSLNVGQRVWFVRQEYLSGDPRLVCRTASVISSDLRTAYIVFSNCGDPTFTFIPREKLYLETVSPHQVPREKWHEWDEGRPVNEVRYL